MGGVLGAILITGYFGGALAAHLLAGDPIGNFIVPTLIPVLAWLSVYLIDDRLRALLPVRRRVKWLGAMLHRDSVKHASPSRDEAWHPGSHTLS